MKISSDEKKTYIECINYKNKDFMKHWSSVLAKYQDILSNEDLDILTDKTKSREYFKVDYAVILKVNPNGKRSEQVKMGGKTNRYYEKITQTIKGVEYFFTEELYGAGRSHPDNKTPLWKWLGEKIGIDLRKTDIANNKSKNDYKSKDNKEVWRDMRYSKNSILFGPPGTGKTYNTVNYAVAICEDKSIDSIKNEKYDKVRSRYNALKEDGRIEFITFHQSYGYEDFIEGIKPKVNQESNTVNYVVKPGVFKRFCDRAHEYTLVVNNKEYNNPTIWNMQLNGRGSEDENEIKKYCFEKNCVRLGYDEIEDDFLNEKPKKRGYEEKIWWFQEEMKIGDIILVQKGDYVIEAIGVVTGDYGIIKREKHYRRKRDVEWIVKNRIIDISELNDGYRLTNPAIYKLSRIKPEELLSRIQSSEFVLKKQKKEPFVFIVDEINRGNISKIFGELITSIEETKREGTKEDPCITLPYSGEVFSVPTNVYIIGTMNTADRSIALIDTALRRRFHFIEMMPESSELKRLKDIKGINVIQMLETMNKRIEILFDREHMIGHAYFMKLDIRNSEEENFNILRDIFEFKVIPLLQEYFYEDYEKIQYVLGDNAKEDKFRFIKGEKTNEKDFKGNNIDYDMPERIFTVNADAFKYPESYRDIY